MYDTICVKMFSTLKKGFIILHAVIVCVGKGNVALNSTFGNDNATLVDMKTSIYSSLVTL